MQCSGLDALFHRLSGEGRQWEQREGSDCEMGGAPAVMVTVSVLLTFRIPESRTLNTLHALQQQLKKENGLPPKASDAPVEKC